MVVLFYVNYKNEIVIGQNSAVLFQSWQLYVILSANQNKLHEKQK